MARRVKNPWLIAGVAAVFGAAGAFLVFGDFADSTKSQARPYDADPAQGYAKPGQIRWKLERTIETKMQRVFSLNVYDISLLFQDRRIATEARANSGTLLVAGGTMVREFSQDGALMNQFAFPEEIRAALRDLEGNLVVATVKRVQIWDGKAEKKLKESSILGNTPNITALAWDGKEYLVADTPIMLSGLVRRLGPDLVQTGLIAADPENGRPLLKIPSNTASQNAEQDERSFLDVTASDDGILVTHPGHLRVEKYDRSGALLHQFGKAGFKIDGFCGCCNPVALAQLAPGQVVTAEKGERFSRVKILDGNGEVLEVVADAQVLGENKYAAIDLAILPNKNIAVLDAGANLIRIFRPLEAK